MCLNFPWFCDVFLLLIELGKSACEIWLLRVSKTKSFKDMIFYQKHLINQEISNKLKSVKLLKENIREVKNILNCKMSQIDYVHVYHTSLISNNKTISKIKETHSKKLWNLPQRNSYESAHYIFAELTRTSEKHKCNTS